MASIPIAPGTNSPVERTLQTGDLLFPRAAPRDEHKRLELLEVSFQPLLHGGKLLGEVLGVQPVKEKSAGERGYALTGLSDKPQLMLESARSGVFDPNRPDHLLLLLKILDATFSDLTQKWLGMTVAQFIRHPISRILIDAINKDLGNGFFVGHCALVLRERAGHHADDGQLFVIEANITDFSHYRVSIHPYSDTPQAGMTGSGHMRGWVNYRCALGQQVWHARPAALAGNPPAARATREAITRQARTLLGRPYGFFDHPDLGETDRLYCSEFVLSVFRSVGGPQGDLAVDDRRYWRWLLENMPQPSRQQLEADLRHEGLYERVINTRFFLLTVQMLWRSAHVQAQFRPGNVEYA